MIQAGGGPGSGSVVGRVVSVNTSAATGVAKQPRPSVELAVDHGVAGDAHAGPWHRQVSLLAEESIERMRACGADVSAGAFGENVTTRGVVVHELPLETRLRLGPCLVEVTQIGKECHDRCAIFHQVGDCVMPREGIFVRVLRGGPLMPGDEIRVLGVETRVAQGGDAPGDGASVHVDRSRADGEGERVEA
jgi:MOSC domain-containing protein YiiM